MIEKRYNYQNIIKYIKLQIVNIDAFNDKKLKENVEISCPNCGKSHLIIKKHLIHSYLKHFNSGDVNYKKYCSNNCYALSVGYTLKTKRQCLNCNVSFIGNKNQKFCSHKCSALISNKNRILSDGVVNMLKLTGKQQYLKHLYNPKFRQKDKFGFFTLICKVCKKEFKHIKTYRKTCSTECYKIDNKLNSRKGWEIGYNSIHRKTGRSYNEKYFFDLIKFHFPDALNNRRIFNGYDADVIIPSLKLAIHWNGIWHYEVVINKEHFEKIKQKDILQYKEIENCGYTNYIIEDKKSCKNYNFVYEKYIQFLNTFRITQSQPLGGSVLSAI